MKAGIQTRLLLTTTLVLGTSLSLAGFVLDRSFQASVFAGAEEQLRLVIYALMGAVDNNESELEFRAEPEPRLNQPESGLYARVDNADGQPRWRSPSTVITTVPFPDNLEPLQPGEWRFVDRDKQGGKRGGKNGSKQSVGRFFLSYAVIWEDDSILTFRAATDQEPFLTAVQGFRRNLYVGLGAVTVLLVIAQVIAVRWGLLPMRTMAEEVRELEEGNRERLSDEYPVELKGLAQNLDRFIAHEQRSRSRYRKAMDDLAHSLKTPLAVIRNAVDVLRPEDASLLNEQLDRMEGSVSHQLSRAVLAGPMVVSKAVEPNALIERLLRALATAYVDRGICVETRLGESAHVRVDEGDLLEMLGNLLENAFKYADSRIRVSAGGQDQGMQVVIEDDGPGIAPELRTRVLNRGTRADEVRPGQGIGLSVVTELVEAYQGELVIAESELGGAAITVRLP